MKVLPVSEILTKLFTKSEKNIFMFCCLNYNLYEKKSVLLVQGEKLSSPCWILYFYERKKVLWYYRVEGHSHKYLNKSFSRETWLYYSIYSLWYVIVEGTRTYGNNYLLLKSKGIRWLNILKYLNFITLVSNSSTVC